MSITVSLNDNWKMKKAGSQESFDCKVPCSVYKTLLDYKKIPDPYYRENEYISTQICDDDYDFETTFTADKAAVECEHTVLHFDGIDTIANVYLNGIHLGRVNNMHRVWEFPVHGIIKEGDNTLTVKITSPNRYIKEMDEKRHLWGVDSTMTGYTHIRKAHCMFGWDWGPMLPDMGIWRSVSLVIPQDGRILDVYYSQKHTDNKVTLKALLHIENHGCKKAMVEISDPQGNIAAKADISLEESAEYYETELVINDPQLWWVNGYGEQPLYNCAVTLYDENDACTDKNTQRIGLRTLTVSREKDRSSSILLNEWSRLSILPIIESLVFLRPFFSFSKNPISSLLFKFHLTCFRNVHFKKLGNTLFLHRYAIQNVSFFHCSTSVSNGDKLCFICKVVQILCIFTYVHIIKRRFYLIEKTER